MTRAIPYLLAILALLVSVGSASSEGGCQLQMTGKVQSVSDALYHERLTAFAEDAPILLAQSMQLQQGNTMRLTGRVPRGKTYAIQREGRREFDILATGATLPQVDCVQIPCPSSFDPEVVCWKCKESLTSE